MAVLVDHVYDGKLEYLGDTICCPVHKCREKHATSNHNAPYWHRMETKEW